MASGRIVNTGYSISNYGYNEKEKGELCLFIYGTDFFLTEMKLQPFLTKALEICCPEDIIFKSPQERRHSGNILRAILSHNEEYICIERFNAKNCILTFPGGEFVKYYPDKDHEVFQNPHVEYKPKLDPTLLKYYATPDNRSLWFDPIKILTHRVSTSNEESGMIFHYLDPHEIKYNKELSKVAIIYRNFDVEIYNNHMELLHTIYLSREMDYRYTDYLDNALWNDQGDRLALFTNFSVIIISFNTNDNFKNKSLISGIHKLRLAGESNSNLISDIPLWNKNQTEIIYYYSEEEPHFYQTKLDNMEIVENWDHEETDDEWAENEEYRGEKEEDRGEKEEDGCDKNMKIDWKNFEEFDEYFDPQEVQWISYKEHPSYHYADQSEILIVTRDVLYIFKTCD